MELSVVVVKSKNNQKEKSPFWGDFSLAVKRFIYDERGMETAEYMIIGTVMGAGMIAAVKYLREAAVDKFDQMAEALDGSKTP